MPCLNLVSSNDDNGVIFSQLGNLGDTEEPSHILGHGVQRRRQLPQKFGNPALCSCALVQFLLHCTFSRCVRFAFAVGSEQPGFKLLQSVHTGIELIAWEAVAVK